MPCWPKARNRVNFGLTALGGDCGTLSASFFFIITYINNRAMGYILVGRLIRLKALLYKINAEFINKLKFI